MKKAFNKSTARLGCYDEYGQAKQNQFLPNAEFTIQDVLNADVPLKDKAWFIRKNCELTTDELRQFAIGSALCVLPIYEAKYPGNSAPRKAIEAAQAYLRNEITRDELLICRRAAYAAYAAAAYAADAYAAYAAYAADAADAAAYAAYADAEPVSYKDLLLNFFKEFTK